MAVKIISKKILKGQPGFSVVELIIALAVFSLVITGLVTMATGGFNALNQGADETEAEALAQEGSEAVRAIRDMGWNNLIYNSTGLQIVDGKWEFMGEGTNNTIGRYTRAISIQPVCRDVSNNITACPGQYTDIYVKKITLTITWTTPSGKVNTVQRIEYVTNWAGKYWTQTDWSGGPGQTIWSSATRYDSDDGNLDYTSLPGAVALKTLTSTSTATTTWAFSTSTDYTYTPSLISVSGGIAQLVSTTTYSTSTTLNPNFTSNANSWTYADWEGGARPNGTWVATGGNPTGYVNISIAGAKGVTDSGYWRQSFTTTNASPSPAVLYLDWRCLVYSPTRLTSYILYAFVDSTSGAPTLGTQVWSQTITGTTGWATVSNINVASRLGAAGTYYLKIAARRITSSGGGTAGTQTNGYDNVHLDWRVPGASSYPTSSPTITPASSFSTSSILSWNSFVETATKNGGEIYYQLSSDDGATWQYWNGSWVAAGATNYNTAAIINTNIPTFTTSTGQIKFKAFLTSNGAQLVQLDNIDIGYDKSGAGSAYAATGYLISSALNMVASSSVQLIEWDEDKLSCAPNCSVRLQVRTAPDNSGAPGTWTSWYGTDGAGTYYSTSSGELLNTALNNNKWVQYRAELTGDGNSTPFLNEVRLDYR
jgi:hypothetical protein